MNSRVLRHLVYSRRFFSTFLLRFPSLTAARDIINLLRRDGQTRSSAQTLRDDVTIWWMPSPHWQGALYRAETVIAADPETVFSYLDPVPGGAREKWDKAVKELQVVDNLDKDLRVIRTITHSAFGGLVSSRDFTDLSVTVRNDEMISTNATGVDHPGCPPVSNLVRGTNYPCALICFKIPNEPNRTRVTTYIQTDLGGLLPKTIVESALPSNMMDFFSGLKTALKEDGHLSKDD